MLSGIGLLWRGPANDIGTAPYEIAQYEREAATLKLAPGWRWPVHPPFDSDSGYGNDAGTMQAQERWLCSWETRAVDPGISAQERRAAIAQLPMVRKMTFYENFASYAPEEQRRIERTIRKAQRGDLTALRLDAAGCAS